MRNILKRILEENKLSKTKITKDLDKQILDLAEKYTPNEDYLQLRENIDDITEEVRELDNKMLRLVDEENFVKDIMAVIKTLVDRIVSIDNKTDLIMEKLGLVYRSAEEKDSINFS